VSRERILVAAPLGLGAVLLAWAALSPRPEPPPKTTRRPGTAARKAPVPRPPEEASISPSLTPPEAPTPEPAGEEGIILERVRAMEEKVRTLESKRDTLATENDQLQKQAVEKSAEISARSMAQGRVMSWEMLLGLTPEQKRSLTDLWSTWMIEDRGKAAGHDAWGAREAEIRARLTTDQAMKLHDSAAAQGKGMWSHMGRSLGSMVGASPEDQTRLQQALGEYFAPSDMLLPEAHGADWKGMMREASNRIRPLLTADQTDRLDRMVKN